MLLLLLPWRPLNLCTSHDQSISCTWIFSTPFRRLTELELHALRLPALNLKKTLPLKSALKKWPVTSFLLLMWCRSIHCSLTFTWGAPRPGRLHAPCLLHSYNAQTPEAGSCSLATVLQPGNTTETTEQKTIWTNFYCCLFLVLLQGSQWERCIMYLSAAPCSWGGFTAQDKLKCR